MTLQIGRTEVSTDGPYDLVVTGTSISFSFDLAETGATFADIQWRALQLQGLRVGDIIPFQWSDDKAYNGFYRVASPVQITPSEAYLDTGFMWGSITLTRIGRSWAAPTYEIIPTETNRSTSTHSVTKDEDDVWMPNTFSAAEISSTKSIDLESSNASLEMKGFFSPHVVIPVLEDWYIGACAIEIKWTDDNWYPLVGLDVPLDPDATEGDMPEFRLSSGNLQWRWENGEVYCRNWSQSNVYDEDLVLDTITSSSSVSDPDNRPVPLTSAGAVVPRQYQVIQNDEHRCTVRLISELIDPLVLTVQRGERVMHVSSDVPFSVDFHLVGDGDGGTPSAISGGGGVEAYDNTGGSKEYVVLSEDTDFTIEASASAEPNVTMDSDCNSFAIGKAHDHDSAEETPAELAANYWAGISVRTRFSGA